MKKLLIMVIFLSIVNLIILINILVNVNLEVEDFALFNKCDTVINKIRIDSIEYVIRSKDSIVNNIKIETNNEIENANALTDTATVELFKRLVSK